MARPKQMVILVHGMGKHPKGQIKKDFSQALKDRADSFGIKSEELLKSVDYREFNYSEKFDLIRNQFADNAEARKKGFAFLTGKGFEEKLITQLTDFESNFGKDEFFYTHWLDVILYGTMYFGEQLRVEFIKLYDSLRQKYNHRNIHIICHSLGTAVVHDALAKYYRKDSSPLDDIPDVPTGKTNMASLWTFANVSRMVNILNSLADPMHSTVTTGSEGCTSRFINVRNKYDPFTWFKTFKRKMDPNEHIVINTIRKVNTHDFYEYITEPSVSRGLLQLVYNQKVTPAQYQKGVDQYRKDAITAQVKDFRDLVDAAANDPSIDNLDKAIAKFKQIRRKIDELSN